MINIKHTSLHLTATDKRKLRQLHKKRNELFGYFGDKSFTINQSRFAIEMITNNLVLGAYEDPGKRHWFFVLQTDTGNEKSNQDHDIVAETWLNRKTRNHAKINTNTLKSHY